MQHVVRSSILGSRSSLTRVLVNKLAAARPLSRTSFAYQHRNSSSSSSSPAQPPNTTTTMQSENQTQTQGRGLSPDWSAPVVTYEQVKAHARAPPPGTYLIDVREKDEVAQGMIPTAVNVPLSGFIDSLRSSPEEFRRLHGFAKPRPDQEIIFYCRSGKRSATAADSARDNGFTNIKNYSGSWLDWVKKTQENDYNL